MNFLIEDDSFFQLVDSYLYSGWSDGDVGNIYSVDEMDSVLLERMKAILDAQRLKKFDSYYDKYIMNPFKEDRLCS